MSRHTFAKWPIICLVWDQFFPCSSHCDISICPHNLRLSHCTISICPHFRHNVKILFVPMFSIRHTVHFSPCWSHCTFSICPLFLRSSHFKISICPHVSVCWYHLSSCPSWHTNFWTPCMCKDILSCLSPHSDPELQLLTFSQILPSTSISV